MSDGGFLPPRTIEIEETRDSDESFTGDGAFGNRAFPEPTSHGIPTADFRAVCPVVFDLALRVLQRDFVREEEVEDALGIGLDVAAEALKPRVYGALVSRSRWSKRM